MPFPLILPFLAKGIVVAAKVLASKGAAATATKATTVAVKAVGLKSTVVAIGTGLVVAGGLHWTYEQYLKATAVVQKFHAGDAGGAASDLTKLIASFGAIGDNDFLQDAQDWVDAGMNPTSSQFTNLVVELKRLLNGMIETGQTPSPI
jgi:hypothetical protein